MPKTDESASSRQQRTELKAEERISQRGGAAFERRPTTAKRVQGIRGDAGAGTFNEATYRSNSRFFGKNPGPGPTSSKPTMEQTQATIKLLRKM